jgi:hypothetical protein
MIVSVNPPRAEEEEPEIVAEGEKVKPLMVRKLLKTKALLVMILLKKLNQVIRIHNICA